MSVSFGRTDRKQSGIFASHLILFSYFISVHVLISKLSSNKEVKIYISVTK